MAGLKVGLSRGDFNAHSVHVFQSLFGDINFSDVTLVCEDQSQVKVHKVILSSASQFFKQILLKNPHTNPLIYLKVKYYHLCAIVTFIYLGQCEIDQSDVETFLEIAKDLQIDGLFTDKLEESSAFPQATKNQQNIKTESPKQSDPSSTYKRRSCFHSYRA